MSATPFNLPDWESLELIGHETVGRLCIIEQGYPLAFPVNFRLLRDVDRTQVVFRTVPHAAIGRYEGPASLEVDRIESNTAWSVILRGELRRVIGRHQLPDTFPLIVENRHQYVILTVNSLSGRRFVSQPAPNGFVVEWQPADA